MKRYATVNVPAGHTGTDYSRTVSAYLPSNYRVCEIVITDRVYLVIEGEDRAGWTLAGYVIPRLWSGLIAATEVSGPPGLTIGRNAPPAGNDGRDATHTSALSTTRNHPAGELVTIYKLNHFTMTDAEPLTGKVADITEWGGDELETKITYPAAKVTGIIDRTGQYLNIATSGAVITDAGTGARLGTRPAEPDWNVGFAWICEVANVRDP